MATDNVKISVAEVCEVRGYGLNAPELLSLAVNSAEKLPRCPKGTAFDSEHVFITNKGTIDIQAVPSTSVAPEFLPPEWAKGEEDPQAAAVYCIGAVLRSAGAEEASDVDLFSLVNILTVHMTGTRPTAHRMGLMARNQLRGRDPNSMLMCVYEELMGDEEQNQIDDADMSDLDDELLSQDENHRTPEIINTVTTSKPTKKAAVDYYDEDDEVRGGASTSSSSGNSTQKEHSPYSFFEDENLNKVPEQNERIHDTSSTFTHYEETSIDGSPASRNLNDTFIEERSINLSFGNDKSDESAILTTIPTNVPTTAVQEPTPIRPTRGKAPPPPIFNETMNPFEVEDDERSEMRDGTLSGRDPFDEGDITENHKEAERNGGLYGRDATVANTSGYSLPEIVQQRSGYGQKLAHRLSSSSEEIIEAHVPTDDEDDDDKPFSAPKQAPPPKLINNIYDEPPLDSYTTTSRFPEPVKSTSSLTPLEEAQKALRANKAKHRPSALSNLSTVDEASPRPPSRQRHPSRGVVQETSILTDEPTYDEVDETDSRKRHEDDFVDVADEIKKTKLDDDSHLLHSETMSSRQVSKTEEDDIDAIFDQYKKDSVQKEEYDDRQLRAEPVIQPAPEPKIGQGGDAASPFLKRRNSLVASKVIGRKSTRRSTMRKPKRTRAIPEFYDLQSHGSVRLRAPTSKKKRLSLHKVEETEVTVELLNGQKIEVGCKSDVIARDVFSLIVQNMNLNEHIFFGLSFMRDGEHYFLDDHQRLEKFAPSGWKSLTRTGVKSNYMLFLRFRYYPQILDFIKTNVTMHQLYLQCRRDILEDRIQPKRDAAFELAALSLQSEFGNRPPPVITDYFDSAHYLPKRYCTYENSERLRQILAEVHGHYSGTRKEEAEHKFIQICQRHADFGCHLHRVFRSKPTTTHGASPLDPDTGSSLWIGIMPRGIRIYELQGGARDLLVEHVWPHTQTLQFDKKRFVIVASDDGDEQVESTFYTDHHSKSSYFVKFAASQHRWMMKMRQWKSTLRQENTIQGMPDVCVEGREVPKAPSRASLDDDNDSPLDSASSIFAKVQPKSSANTTDSRPTSDPPVPPVHMESTATTEVEHFERIKKPEDDESESGRKINFDVLLIKDPAHGLGLTLVDGNLNNIPGVYVKLVADNGAGQRAGLAVGDRIVAVAGQPLHGQERLRAVELVKECGERVPLSISRLDGVTRHVRNVSHETPPTKKHSTSSNDHGLSAPTSRGMSRTPPPPRKAANRRQRAVSDFGAIGDALPTLDGDNLLDIRAISGLELNESDDEKGEYRLPTTSMYSFDREEESLPSSAKEKPLQELVPPAEGRKYRYARRSNMGIREEIEEESSDDEGATRPARVIDVTLERNSNGSLGVQIASQSGRVCIKQLTAEPALSQPDIRVGDLLLYVNGVAVEGKTHSEVVQMLRGGGEVVVLGVQHPPSTNGTAPTGLAKSPSSLTAPLISVVLQKKPSTTLGLQLAKRTMTDGIFVRKIAPDSVAAQEGTLRVGDRLVTLDGEAVDGLTPASILKRLEAVQGPVTITVTRGTNDR